MSTNEHNLSDESNSNGSDNRSPSQPVNNKFANDGSFLEMFKQMQKNMNSFQSNTSSSSPDSKTTDSVNNINEKTVQTAEDLSKVKNDSPESEAKEVEDNNQSNSSSAKKSFVNINKRKPKSLRTGIIKKQKNDNSDEEESGAGPTDAWNRYMKEVRKYKEKYGDDNDKNRPLVK